MALRLPGALRNRRVQLAGVAVAGGAGLYVWHKRKTAAGGAGAGASSDTSGTGGTAGGTVAGGFPDTSATDLATVLGDYQQGTQQMLAQYQDQLTAIQTTLANLQPTVPPGTGSVGHPAPGGPVTLPAPKPSPVPRPPSTPGTPPRVIQTSTQRFVPVVRFTSVNPAWNSTLSGIAGHEHTTIAALMRLNPQITNPNLIRDGSQVRVA